MIRCEEAIARLWDFLDGELPPDQEGAVLRHLEVCNRCYPQYDFRRAYLEFTWRVRRAGNGATAEFRRRLFRLLLEQEGAGEGGGGER
jgi:hypothetical protein